jgi:hypothetical protein
VAPTALYALNAQYPTLNGLAPV